MTSELILFEEENEAVAITRRRRGGACWRCSARLARAAGATAALWLAAVSPAGAVTLSDVTPLYFSGPDRYGFDARAVRAAGRTADFTATAGDNWIDAPGPKVAITQQVETLHQVPSELSLATPAIVDSTWTVTNVGAGNLVAPLLVFTSLDPNDTYANGSPKPLQGLDVELLKLLAYSYAGKDYLFGAAQLPDLQEGESASFTVRYVIASALLARSESQRLAPMGVSLLGGGHVAVTVPEPSTRLLLSLGLTVTCTWGFRRRRSSTALGGSDSSP